ncbi:unnamed protein product [Porites lobata]|uniref:Uncharacterized protein n=1 Tax=Porites lobata TaxID=104759 RepID=A0ABN8P1N7_9CNID|nr:unnamed protein product [Porites lobata]
MYSAIAIGLLVGVTVLSVGVFGAMAYAVASRKTKDKDSKYGHQYPVSSHGIFPGRICLEVVTLNTKLTVIISARPSNRQGSDFRTVSARMAVLEICLIAIGVLIFAAANVMAIKHYVSGKARIDDEKSRPTYQPVERDSNGHLYY